MRLVTRGDLDGLTCAVLLTSVERIERIELVHPQELTDRKFQILPGDVITNLPYQPNCAMWFDHHGLTETNLRPEGEFVGIHRLAPSAARLVFEFLCQKHGTARLARYEHLLAETDRFDAAELTVEDVVDPKGLILLGFTLDARTGLGSFRDYFLFLGMALRSMTLEEVLAAPQVVERVEKMRSDDARFRKALLENSKVHANVVVTDFRDLTEIPVGNRFLVYTLFPDCTVSVRLQWGPRKECVMATAGHNIFDRSSWSDIGHTMAIFGGGGHKGAGSAPLPTPDADRLLGELVKELKRQG
jgi:nanoRNase/pAp phosphatase (c-di-AMP/oligoRNAs hydrolase)